MTDFLTQSAGGVLTWNLGAGDQAGGVLTWQKIFAAVTTLARSVVFSLAL
jgi:hypothetical protein